MSIAWYPLEADEPPRPPPPSAKPVAQRAPMALAKQTFMQGETSECNYVVLVFVVGVLFLAISDAMRR
jgi:hypothetical protein